MPKNLYANAFEWAYGKETFRGWNCNYCISVEKSMGLAD